MTQVHNSKTPLFVLFSIIQYTFDIFQLVLICSIYLVFIGTIQICWNPPKDGWVSTFNFIMPKVPIFSTPFLLKRVLEFLALLLGEKVPKLQTHEDVSKVFFTLSFSSLLKGWGLCVCACVCGFESPTWWNHFKARFNTCPWASN